MAKKHFEIAISVATVIAALMLAPSAVAGPHGGSLSPEQAAAAQIKANGPRIIEDSPFVSQTGGQTNPKFYGKTIGEWSAAWWQWAGSFPSGENPIEDTTGEYCDIGQSGPVWFLAGTFGGSAERSCTIPAGKAIFYPLVNVAWVDCPGDEIYSDNLVRWVLEDFAYGWCEMSSTLDTFYSPLFGADLEMPVAGLMRPALRSQSPVFNAIVPEDDIWGECTPEPGITGRMISDGHWVMLPPLEPGEHVLTLHGARCSSSFGFDDDGNPIEVVVVDVDTGEELEDVQPMQRVFETEVTYHLTVSPKKGKK
jgi:hypothetical protein